MKSIRIATRTLFCLFSVLSVLVFSAIIYIDAKLSDSYKISQGESLEIDSSLPISISYLTATDSGVEQGGVKNSFDAKIKVFGIIPARNITVNVIDNYYVSVLGTPFGIKIYTDGVLVIGFSEVDTSRGKVNPAKSAGIKEGDFIVSLDGVKVYTNEEVMNIIKNSMGEYISAKIVRNGVKMTIRFKAGLSSDGVYRAGMWVRDSSAGIGTLTFYSPSVNVVSGLGHGINDSDTDTLLTLNRGEFVTARIVSVIKGKSGSAGELVGHFSGKTISTFETNCEQGVYGISKCDIDTTNLMRVAMKQEVKNGPAYILTTIDGVTPHYYSCNIKVKGMGETQNILVEITDEKLLSATGGIVQGMSGSPVVQNGKLVGAVTHVLVDDPTKGYGIFAENMLETAQKVAEEQEMKDAS